jgi:hypothetical protein
MLTASILFAGNKHITGENRCYYCGADCDSSYHAADFVKPTFTNRDIVKFPGSEYVCTGCALSLGQGDDEMMMIDGIIKKRENQRGMQPRMYSWILTREKKLAATKAHIRQLKEAILCPPDPPFSIILSDSGQKQLIFRAPIALDRSCYALLLEDIKIELSTNLLAERLSLALPVCAALGKPALLGEMGINTYIRFEEYCGDISGLERWLRIREEPLSRLAAWLSPSKEDAKHEYPGIERGRVSAKTGRVNRPGSSNAGRGKGRSETGRDQLHFDFGGSVR